MLPVRFAKRLLFCGFVLIAIITLSGCDLLSPEADTPTAVPTAVAQGTALQQVTVTPPAQPAASLTATRSVTPTPSATPLPESPTATPSATATRVPPTDVPTATVTVPTATMPPSPTPTLPPTPIPTIESTPDTFWETTYFAGKELEGSPILSAETEQIGHYWGTSRPDGIPEEFSVRWERKVTLSQQSYHVYLWHNDGVRVRINNVVVFEDWEQGPTRHADFIIGVEEATFQIEVEHFQTGPVEDFYIWWSPTDQDADWAASYWPNLDFTGSPAVNRLDEAIAFDWSTGAPAPELPNDAFSVRWTRTAYFAAGNYRFSAAYDDGMRLFVDGRLVFDDWVPGVRRDDEVVVWLREGSHEIVVDYFERQGEASINLSWEAISMNGSGWHGEFYSNPYLAGPATHLNVGANLDFDWGVNGPLPTIPNDQFSIRWTRLFDFEAGIYQISVEADDGVRVYVNGVLVIDEWHESTFGSGYERNVQLSGRQTVEVLYYDNRGPAAFRFTLLRIGPPIE